MAKKQVLTIDVVDKEAVGKDLLHWLLAERTKTPNVMRAPLEEIDCGAFTLRAADDRLREICQNCIEVIRDHRHLREAVVLLLIKDSEGDQKKLEAGARIVAGRGQKAGPRDRLLSSLAVDEDVLGLLKGLGRGAAADFVVTLSRAALDAMGWFDGTEQGVAYAAALIDHELSHCGTKIAGEFIYRGDLEGRVAAMGPDHVETCEDVRDGDGKVLVRYFWRDDHGRLKFCGRKHDLEEFDGVARRHGAWNPQMRRFVDVVVRQDAPLFSDRKETA